MVFSNSSVISGQSVLLVEETGVPGENHRPAASHWQTVSHNAVSSTPRLRGIRPHNFSVISTDWIGSCKSNSIQSRRAPYIDVISFILYYTINDFS